MRKNVLALSIAAMIGGLGFAGVATAGVIAGTGGATVTTTTLLTPTVTGFKVTEGGVGHQLVVPYYNAQNGNMTVIHLVNTDTVQGKVAKIRFRGAANSDDVLDFQILLSPGDVWTGAVTAGADGYANIVTGDNTCTIPALTKGVGQPFKNGRLNPNLAAADLAANTREGYVEIFNAADIPSDSIYTVGGVAGSKSALYTAIKHVNGVAPCTSAPINTALFTTNFTTELAAAGAGLGAPTGGLMGDWYIINVPQTTTYSGAATALVGTGGNVGNFVAFPQNDAINIATPENFTADPALVSLGLASTTKLVDGTGLTATTAAVITAIALDFPDLSTPYFGAATPANALTQAALLTRALAVTSITNEFAKDPTISAKTDWTFSMPTRRYSVALDYSKQSVVAPVTPPARVFSVVNGAVNNVANTTQYFYTGNTTVEAGKICVNSQGTTLRDREETGTSGAPVFSPSTATQTRFCGETSVLSFAEGITAPSVLAASIARQDVALASTMTNGWGSVDTTNGTVGLPILGASFIKLTNPSATTGVSGTYGIQFPHRFTKVNP